MLYFDRKTKNQTVVDEMIGNVESPTENMSPLFTTGTGSGRNLWEHLLKEEGEHEVMITVRKTLYTDDEEVVRLVDDKSRGKWRSGNESHRRREGPRQDASGRSQVLSR